ncbi:MAG: hypothetical protein JSR66_18675 [Proteobacteria bacterium]|nr:hypothetical protein [Pseudomonadota bacterium]
MAQPAVKFELQKDVSDLKVDIRRLNDKIDGVDQKLSAKIDTVEEKLTAKIDAVEEKLTAKIDAVDQKLNAKIDAVDQRLAGKIDSLRDVVTALAINMEKQFASLDKSIGTLRTARAFDRVWYLLMSAALLGIMARAFKWL